MYPGIALRKPNFPSEFAISRAEDLAVLDGSLHDQEFNLDDARFDRDGSEWSGKFWIRMPGTEIIKERRVSIFRKRIWVVAAVATVRFENVSARDIEDKSRIGSYSFSSAVLSGNTCTLDFIEDLRITLMLQSSLNGSMTIEQRDDVECYMDVFLGIVDSGLSFKELNG